MRPLTGWQGAVLVSGLLGQRPFWDLYAEYKKENETLDEESASGIVARSLQYTEADLCVNLWPQSGYRVPITVL
jgi:hypothetical protein